MQQSDCKHRILFPAIQHLAWLPQGRPQGKQKCGNNSKNINLRRYRYFKFNREANCNTFIQTFICPMFTATLCNLCYIVVCCELLVYVFWQKVLQYLNNFTKQLRAVCQRYLSFLFYTLALDRFILYIGGWRWWKGEWPIPCKQELSYRNAAAHTIRRRHQ